MKSKRGNSIYLIDKIVAPFLQGGYSGQYEPYRKDFL
jgi:hypothetical protein